MKKIIIAISLIFFILLSNASSAFSHQKIKDVKIGIKNNLSSESKIKLLMKIGSIPSLSACVIKNQSILYYIGYGKTNIIKRTKPTINTIYKVASVSKSVTGTAMMQLWEKGLFDLDEDINKYLDFNVRNPNYPDLPITFRMLLSHQSSFAQFEYSFKKCMLYTLFCGNSFDKLINYPYPWIKEYISPNGKLHSNSVWSDTSPGEKAAYSNVNSILLEHLLEKMTNQSFEEYCKENIFEPLEMFNTSFHYSTYDNQHLATPYITFFGLNLRLWESDIGAGFGGMRTSIEDLSHYLIAHMNGGVWNGTRILNESTVQLMHLKQYPDSLYENLDCYFGLGWEIWAEEWKNMILEGHSGDGFGGSSAMWMNQTEKFGLIVIFNKSSLCSLTPWALTKIADEMYKLYLEKN